MKLIYLSILLPLVASPLALAADAKELGSDYDETILAYFQKPTDTASLLAYLNERSRSDDDLMAIPTLIKQMGNDRFSVRESASKKLISVGLPAILPLCDTLGDGDPERAHRASSTLDRMDRSTGTIALPPTTIRMLMKLKPPKLLETLLRYLPFTTDPQVEEEIYYDIDELALIDGKIHPTLLKALTDKIAARRAIAGCIIARKGNVEQKASALQLLTDPDPSVRLRTAQGFLAGLDKTALPTLIDLLDGKPVSVAWQAEELLSWVAGEAAPKEIVRCGGNDAKKAQMAWSSWWRKAEASIDLKKVAKEDRKPLLYWRPEFSSLIGSNGRERWYRPETNIGSAIDGLAYLPPDRIVGIERKNIEIELKSGELFQELILLEMTLDLKVIRKISGRHKSLAFEAEKCIVEANGIVLALGKGEVRSIGLDGKILNDEMDISGIIGASEGFVYSAVKNPWNIEGTQLIDPLDGETVLRQSFADSEDLFQAQNIFVHSRARSFVVTKRSLWSMEGNKIRMIRELNSYPAAAVLPLRNNWLAEICDNRTYFFSPSGTKKSGNAEGTSTPKTTPDLLFPTVSFGFFER